MHLAMRFPLKLGGILLLAGVCLLAAGSPLAGESAAGSASAVAATDSSLVTVYLVRHAEKAKNDPKDPDLTEAGHRRADELARVLTDEQVTHLFSTPLKRTMDTLAPLAAARSLEIVTMMDVQEQANALLALPAGSVAVLVGHSNTVPALVTALGGEVTDTIEGRAGPQLHDDSNDRMFVALIAPATEEEPAHLLRLLQLRYGEP
jgi:phosphohistidine phosphatase SixA